jgi:hypothetical protein
MKNFVPFSTSAFAAAIAVLQQSFSVNAQYFKTVDEAYNPNEERGSFDLVMEPYPIPAETTTYVDFFFNLPDDLPDLFHVVLGEVINSQPEHLHHFVLTGCPNKIDPSQDGVASEFDVMDVGCLISVGGWAPGGDVFGNTDLDTGIMLGKGLGIQALQLGVHYTDGVYVDEALKTLRMATDGIRVHYTSTFRPYTSISKPLINVGTAPKQLTIPPGESRFYLSRTCEVDTSCKDANQDTLDIMAFLFGMGETDIQSALGGADFSCESVQPFCNIGGEIGPYILQMCPSTCGLCEKGADGTVNPLNPDTYRITGVTYHAHLLGREMYTTLLRDEEEPNTNTTLAIERNAPMTNTIATDLESREFWIFDNQETIPFDFNVFQNDEIMRGTEIKAGDRIQATCVFDSTYRTDPTRFYLSTYDEMCITSTHITFETPASSMNGGEIDAESALDLATEIHLMSFTCADDADGDVYSGILTADEDGRDIWKNHPIGKADGCTYVTSDFFAALTEETRNCDYENVICGPGVELLSENNAGATCLGGTLDQQDANSGVTEEDCTNGGGFFRPYSCEDTNSYLQFETDFDEATMEFLVNQWWKPKCCEGDFSESSSENESDENLVSESSSKDESLEVESEPEAIVSAAAPGFAKSPLGFLSVGSTASVLSVFLLG